MTDPDDIKEIITATILELHADRSVQLRWPSTAQGWVAVFIGIGSVVAGLWSFAIFLTSISKHPNEPFHQGAEELVKELKATIPSEAQIELKMIKQTQPIQSDLHGIREDVSKIQTSVDILLEDARRNRPTHE